MKVISLWQPWASLVADGLKKVETRSWVTNYRGPIAIHAAARPLTSIERGLVYIWGCRGIVPTDWASKVFDRGLPLGCVIATGHLVDCIPAVEMLNGLSAREDEFGDFSDGRWGWMLDDVVRLEKPIRCRGRQGLFDVAI